MPYLKGLNSVNSTMEHVSLCRWQQWVKHHWCHWYQPVITGVVVVSYSIRTQNDIWKTAETSYCTNSVNLRCYGNILVFYFRISWEKRHCEAKLISPHFLIRSSGTPFWLELKENQSKIILRVTSIQYLKNYCTIYGALLYCCYWFSGTLYF